MNTSTYAKRLDQLQAAMAVAASPPITTALIDCDALGRYTEVRLLDGDKEVMSRGENEALASFQRRVEAMRPVDASWMHVVFVRPAPGGGQTKGHETWA